MNIIHYFDKLHVSAKFSAINILALIPFFFISIYLFNHSLIDLVGNHLFSDINFLFVISLCFCLSITWYAMNLILAIIAFDFGDYIYNDSTGLDDILKATVLYSIGYLSIAIFINFKWEISFYKFLILAYGFIIFRLIYIFLIWFIIKKLNKQK